MRQIACAFERLVTHVAPRFDCSIQETDRISVTCLELSGQFPTSFDLLVEQNSSDSEIITDGRNKEYTIL